MKDNILFFLTMFNVAYASEAVANSPSILSFVPIIVLIVVFYIFIIRPQQKRLKVENAMREAVRIGDKILTTSGIFANIVSIDAEKGVFSVEISKGVNITIHKSAIAEVLTPKEPKEEK